MQDVKVLASGRDVNVTIFPRTYKGEKGMGSGALILFCILAGFALVLSLLFFRAQYNIYKIKREAQRKQEEQTKQAEYLIAMSRAPTPGEQIEQRKRDARNAVKEHLEQIAQRTGGPNPALENAVQDQLWKMAESTYRPNPVAQRAQRPVPDQIAQNAISRPFPVSQGTQAQSFEDILSVSYTHLTLPTNREV